MDAASTIPVPVNTAAAVQFAHENALIWIGLNLIAVLVALAFLSTGAGARLRSALDRSTGRRRYLALVLFAWLYLIIDAAAALPLRCYAEVVHWSRWSGTGFPTAAPAAWLVGQAAGLAARMAAAAALLWLPFGLIERRPRSWPLLLTAIVVPALAVALVAWQVLVTPMTTRFEPLADRGLDRQIQAMAARCGAGSVPVLIGGDDVTVVGLGPTSRILVAPWALKLQTRAQLLTTLAHELKHYRMGDNWLAIAVVGALILAGALLVQALGGVVFRLWGDRLGLTSLHDPAAIPLIVLILTLSWSLAGLPIFNAVQQHVEHEADRFALEVTHDNLALSSWQATASQQPWRLVEEDGFTRTFLDTHPSPAERVRFGNSYRPWAQGRPGVYDKVCRPAA